MRATTSLAVLRSTRSSVVALAALGLCLLSQAPPLDAQSSNWPGWRGDGSGVSREVGLPTKWHQIGYRWRTEIEGIGSSSPIVWGDQVFLTTSVERSVVDTAGMAVRWIAVAGGVLVMICLLISFIRSLRPPRDAGKQVPGPTWLRFLVSLEAAAVIALAGYFFWSLADLLLNRQHEFTPEQPDVAWILGGEVAVLGLLAAVGSLAAGSWGRLVGALLLAVGGPLFYAWQPPAASTLPVPIDAQMDVLRPLGMGVPALLLVWLVVRAFGRGSRVAVLPWASALRSLTLALIALVTFSYYNVVEPQLGVMREVWALDRETGEVEWRTGVAAPSGRKWSWNTYATPTPVTNGAFIVADFGPVMVTMDTGGKIVWRREEPRYMDYLRYGAVRSPVIHGDTVIYLYLPENPGVEGRITGERSYLAALSLATGEAVWRVDGIEGGHDSYTSPLLVPTPNGGVSVVVSVFDHAHGYDADTGEKLWSFESPMAHPVPSHVADDGAVYIGGGLYGPQLAAAIDLGPFAPGNDSSQRPDDTPVQLKARWMTNRQTPDISSPLVYDGLVYWVTSDGRMFCHDAQTGDVVWRQRLPGVFEPSPVAGDGKVYVQASDGRTIVLAAGRTFRQLAENRLYEFESSHASIAIARDTLFIRGGDYLFAVGGGASRPAP